MAVVLFVFLSVGFAHRRQPVRWQRGKDTTGTRGRGLGSRWTRGRGDHRLRERTNNAGEAGNPNRCHAARRRENKGAVVRGAVPGATLETRRGAGLDCAKENVFPTWNSLPGHTSNRV